VLAVALPLESGLQLGLRPLLSCPDAPHATQSHSITFLFSLTTT
jgi:hypothetical protein